MTTALKVRISVWVWLLAALWFGQQQVLARLPGLAGPGVILLLTAAVLACYFQATNFRAWVDGLDLRSLVVLHVTRFVGCYFLLLYRRGELPYAFAVPGGWGDILTALLAGLICFVPLRPALRRRAITIWNSIGFVDLLLVVLTAGRLVLENRAQMRALTCLPLSLLPTFLVPLLLATHIIIHLRLRRDQASA